MFCAEHICEACQKVSITVESRSAITDIRHLPNTFDEHTQQFVWRYNEITGYILIPRAFHGPLAIIDLYLCIDERDRETIDISGYAKRFLEKTIMPQYDGVKITSFMGPVLASPKNISCRVKQRLS